MARIAGRNGQIYVQQSGAEATPLLYSTKWSLSASTDNYEVTSFGDTTKTYVAGLADAQGSFSGFYDDTATTGSAYLFSIATAGLAKKVYLYPSTPAATGPYFFGTAFLDFTFETDIGAAGATSGSFVAATSFAKVG